jgi:hypothetical protein
MKVINGSPNRILARPRSVEVFDSQQHSSPGMPRRKPSDQEGPRMPQVQPAGRRRRQASDDLLPPVTIAFDPEFFGHVAIEFS